ncbi:hypothetical protein VTN00DRAFT_6324 [Thermoascus crustaceus]|uniref:uncharacterized protein n=1 Tax=Thermoascus crustaceus TaxID=5088 RepID=UPI00374358BB
MTRILCLHGYGTSSNILKHQLSALIAAADPSFEFVFLDGEVECQKAPGVANLFQGPFLCYNDSFAPADVQQACELVKEFIEAEGPFDGILGYSQGGALALTYLLQHEIEKPSEPPPFQFAILLSTAISFSPDDTFCNEILDSVTDREIQLLQDYPQSDLSSLGPVKRALCETTAKAFLIAKAEGLIAPDTNSGSFAKRSDPSQPRPFHPALLNRRIRIPTVHITGKKDHPGFVELSILMRSLCETSVMRALTHSGAHEVPRRADDVKAAWSVIEWAVQQSQRSSW